MNESSPTSLRHTSTPLKSSSLQGIALKDRNPLTGLTAEATTSLMVQPFLAGKQQGGDRREASFGARNG